MAGSSASDGTQVLKARIAGLCYLCVIAGGRWLIARGIRTAPFGGVQAGAIG